MESERYRIKIIPREQPLMMPREETRFCRAAKRGFWRATWLHFWWSLGQAVSGKVRHVRA